MWFRHILLILFLLIKTAVSFCSQREIDSLLNLLESSREDTIKVKNTISLAWQYQNKNPDSASFYAMLALNLSEKIDYKYGMLKAYTNLGNVSYTKSDYLHSLEYFNQALGIGKATNDKIEIGFSHINIGVIYIKQGLYNEAMEAFNKGLIMKQETGEKDAMAAIYTNMGIILVNQGRYHEAMDNYIKSLKIREEIGDKMGMGDIHVNIASIYLIQKNYDEALKYNFLGLKIIQERQDTFAIADTYNNIGTIYENKNDYLHAADYYSKSLKNYEIIGNKSGMAMSYINISSLYTNIYERITKDTLPSLGINTELKAFPSPQSILDTAIYYQSKALEIHKELDAPLEVSYSFKGMGKIFFLQHNYQQALESYMQSKEIAGKMKAPKEQMEAYLGISDVYRAMGKHKEALENFDLYKQWSDSVYTAENAKQIRELQTQYEVEKKDNEIMIKNKEIEIKELLIYKKNYLIAGLIALALMIVVIALLLLRQYKLQAGRKTIELQQKLLRSQMNPHFMYNSLLSIQSYMFENNPDEAAVYLSKFAELMRLILENSREEYVPIEKEIKTLENYLELQKLCYQNTFNYTIQIDPDIDTGFIAIPPMLAQPFIENAIMHGIAGKRADGQVTVRFKLADSIILFEVEDNGIGITQSETQKQPSTPKHKSLATAITKERLQNLNKGNRRKIKFEIIDLADNGNGQQTGTKTIFAIPYVNGE